MLIVAVLRTTDKILFSSAFTQYRMGELPLVWAGAELRVARYQKRSNRGPADARFPAVPV